MTTVELHLVDAGSAQPDLELLDEAERERHAAMGHPLDRHRFAVAHAAARRIVADRLAIAPAGVRWIRGVNGKPELDGGSLRVNLSHSGDLILVALTAARAVGVDLQQVLPTLDVAAMAARFFPAGEAALVAADGPERFAELWARKEAVVKAAGDRLTRGLCLPVAGDPPPVVEHDGRRYALADVAAPVGFRAAVALDGDAPFHVYAPKTLTHR
ncbi:4'-phosphopantetheinyl transferase superfamily protein [Dactylosporangium sp. AC04546]|uniref:4'-phosphopantetheinyl transferase family protein n=1 Tax=Dactylosporangium sp. AC04546 TaxID=2862460 RepID=UPI001EE13B46|nr:4'-phosphopantetheinyl transferase superfamily protein [Dactylosporangium sp. AC04546]WVK86184.1 4'-phosphopantetheinyl transferase superfamily protein [Dactylosporangium sp. AC04546]